MANVVTYGQLRAIEAMWKQLPQRLEGVFDSLHLDRSGAQRIIEHGDEFMAAMLECAKGKLAELASKT